MTLPLSWSQEGLWFLEQAQPGLATYNVPLVMRLGGSLERQKVAAWLAWATARHDALRMSVQIDRGAPGIVISSSPTVDFSCDDLDGVPPALRAAEAQLRASAASREPFDLQRPPLLRVRLYEIGPTEPVLLLVAHHLVADGQSIFGTH